MNHQILLKGRNSYTPCNFRQPVLFISVVVFLSSCYTTNRFASENRQTASILNTVISKADAISVLNSEKIQSGYIDPATGTNLQHFVDSVKRSSVNQLGEMPLLTKERIRHRDLKYVRRKTQLLRKEAENNIKNLVIAEQLVTTIRALMNTPATGGQTAAVLKETLQKIDDINHATEKKLKENTLDPSGASAIKKLTDTIKNQTLRHLHEDSIISNMPNKHKHAEDISNRVRKLAAEAQKNLDDVKLVDELLKTNTFTLVNSGTLFGPGKFVFTPDKMPAVEAAFGPAINNLFSFTDKFLGKKLDVYLVVLGYSDAGNISAASTLGKTLLDSMDVQTAPASMLNKELSRLRAASVVSFFRSKENEDTRPGVLCRYLPQGRGEELPDLSIRDYKVNDVRRREVKVYWTVLPGQ